MKTPSMGFLHDPLNRAILAARQAVCFAEMLRDGKHLFCGHAYRKTWRLLPNCAIRLHHTPWRPDQ